MSTQFNSDTHIATNGAIVEVGTVTHEGRDFAALGSVLDEASGIIAGYPKGNRLTTWEGEVIDGLRLTVTSTWKTPRSYLSSTQSAYSATYKGKRYHGRGAGDSILLRLRLSK